MKIEPVERFSGIEFASAEHAYSALLLCIADLRCHAHFNGPGRLKEIVPVLDNPEQLLDYDFFRLNSVRRQLEENGECYKEYGSHIASLLTSMTLQIKRSPNGAVLEILPDLDNDILYEETLIGILNNHKDERLTALFGKKPYERLMERSGLRMEGTEQEMQASLSLIKGKFKVRTFPYPGGNEGFDASYNYVPPSDGGGGNLPASFVEVRIIGDQSSKTMNIDFYHPNSYKKHYHPPAILRGVRNQFQKSLETIVQPEQKLLAP